MAMWSCPRLNGHRTYAGVDVGYSLGTFFYRNHEYPSPEWRSRGKLGRHPRGWLAAPGSQLCPARQNPQGLFSLSAVFSAWDNMAGWGLLSSAECSGPSQTQLASGKFFIVLRTGRLPPELHFSQKGLVFLRCACL